MKKICYVLTMIAFIFGLSYAGDSIEFKLSFNKGDKISKTSESSYKATERVYIQARNPEGVELEQAEPEGRQMISEVSQESREILNFTDEVLETGKNKDITKMTREITEHKNDVKMVPNVNEESLKVISLKNAFYDISTDGEAVKAEPKGKNDYEKGFAGLQQPADREYSAFFQKSAAAIGEEWPLKEINKAENLFTRIINLMIIGDEGIEIKYNDIKGTIKCRLNGTDEKKETAFISITFDKIEITADVSVPKFNNKYKSKVSFSGTAILKYDINGSKIGSFDLQGEIKHEAGILMQTAQGEFPAETNEDGTLIIKDKFTYNK